MSARFVAHAAAALVLATAVNAGAQQASATPAPSPAQSPVPLPSPTPVNLPPVPATTRVDPYTRAAIDLLTGAVNRAISNIGNTASGKIAYFKRFDLQLQTGPTSYRDVHLHQGTIIDPRGTTLSAGLQVDVSGVPRSDGSLEANVITVH